jgi:glucan phosphoethanolaminetransferase (alkaline phosphatase superfamily)
MTWIYLLIWILFLGGLFVVFLWLSGRDYEREKKLEGGYLIFAGLVLGFLILVMLMFLTQEFVACWNCIP